MPIDPIQVSHYSHTFDLWRKTEVLATDGEALYPTWALQQAAVPGRMEVGQSQQGPGGSFIHDENDNLFTLDTLYLPLETEDGTAVTMDVNWCVKMTAGPEAGQYWMLRGNPQRYPDDVMEWQQVLCNRIPAAPQGVS